MMRALVTLLVLLSGCATTTQVKLPVTERPVCYLTETGDTGSLSLRIPGRGPVYATTSYASWGSPRIEGELHVRERAVLELWLTGGGLSLAGDVDASEDHVVSLVGQQTHQDWLALAAGAMVHVVGGTKGTVEVAPSKWALEDFEPSSPPVLKLGCEAITLSRILRLPEQDQKEIADIGFDPSADRVRLRPDTPVPLHASPGGELRGRLLPSEHGHWVRLVERRVGWARILKSSWTGTHLFGWVEDTLIDEEPDEGMGGLMGVLGGIGKDERPPPLRCEKKLPVSVRVGEVVKNVGQLEAHAPFWVLVEGGIEGRIAVELADTFVRPVKGAVFLLPAEARGCPEGPPLPPRPTGLEGLFEKA